MINCDVNDIGKYIKPLPFGMLIVKSLIFLGLVFVDWEYGVNIGQWDGNLKEEERRARVMAINSVVSNPDSISFNW
jgi:hypothetical protein